MSAGGAVLNRSENRDALVFPAKVLFILSWADLCIRLVLRWKIMPSHEEVIFFGLIFPLLWLRLIQERTSGISLVGVAIVFLSVVHYVFRHL